MIATYLKSYLNLPDPPQIEDYEGYCAMSGQPITRGVPVASLIKSTTNDLADTFRGTHVHPDMAACFLYPKITSNWLISPELTCRPMVATASATEDRPTWSHLVRNVLQEGQLAAAVMTSNVQRRLWYRAPMLEIGQRWGVLFVDGDTDCVLPIDFHKFRELMILLESYLDLGLSKVDLRFAGKVCQATPRKLSLLDAMKIETTLSFYRDCPEFSPALFIAQRNETL